MHPLLRFFPGPPALAAGAVAFLALTLPGAEDAAAKGKGCPAGMASVLGRFCIDRYEASTVEILPGGKTRAHSPFAPVEGIKVKAVSKKGVKPQAYISRDQAEEACEAAGKRLCTDDEWITACKGKKPTLYPYGDDRRDGYCNDSGVSSFNKYYGGGNAETPQGAYTWSNMNDPRLNQLEGTLAPTGQFKKCKNGFGVYDMVGNVHEWTAAPGGTFRGGYYLDTHINGDGCEYRTTAHAAKYHDYSTGFRCCK
jgi:formylglycine-generating enzyme